MTQLRPCNRKRRRIGTTPAVREQRLRLDDLPREILSQVFRYLIPSWSLRVDRHITHACGDQSENEGLVKPNITCYVHRVQTLANEVATTPTKYLLLINKRLSKLVRTAQTDAFSGMLEVAHHLFDQHGKSPCYPVPSFDECSCSPVDGTEENLRTALGKLTNRVTACKVDSWCGCKITQQLLRVLPMSRIACIGWDMIRILTFDAAAYPESAFRLGTVPDVDLSDALWQRFYSFRGWRSSFPADVPCNLTRLSASQRKQVSHPQSVNVIVEITITSTAMYPHRGTSGAEFFFVAFLMQKNGEDDHVTRVLTRYTREEGEMLGHDERLRRYVSMFRSLL